MTPEQKMMDDIEEVRMEVHQVRKVVDDNMGNMAQIKMQVLEIRNALLGTEFNDNGLLSQTRDHERRLRLIENIDITHKTYLGILRLIAVAIVTGVITGAIGFVYWLLQAKAGG